MSIEDSTIPVAAQNRFDTAALEAYLRPRIEGFKVASADLTNHQPVTFQSPSWGSPRSLHKVKE